MLLIGHVLVASGKYRVAELYNHSSVESIVEVLQNPLTYVKGEQSGADDHIRR
jgi:hypothetical protein